MFSKVIGDIRIEMDVTGSDVKNHYIRISGASNNITYFKRNGAFNLEQIDKGCMAITKDDDKPSTTLLIASETGVEMRTFYKEAGMHFEIDDDLRKEKKVIMPVNGKQVLFSYGENRPLSAAYDFIKHDIDQFFVRYNIFVDDVVLQLYGFLDAEGRLIGSSLFSPYLDCDIEIDENDINGSIERLYSRIQRLVAKKKKRIRNTQILDFEYEAYTIKKKEATRNRKIV